MERGATVRFSFLCLDEFPIASLSLAMDPLRVANEISGRDVFSWEVVSERPPTVRSSTHTRLVADRPLRHVRNTDVLLVLGSARARFQHPNIAFSHLRRLSNQGTRIGSVSGGIFALAESGLLDGVSCSVHYAYLQAVQEAFPNVACNDTLFSEDQGFITMAGSAAVLEFMLKLIGDHLSKSVATETACWFQHPTIRDEATAQLQPTKDQTKTEDMLPALIQEAIGFFKDHMEDPVHIQDVADLVGLSLRQFERVFKREMGMNPGAYYRDMRLEAGRQKVLYTDHPMREIALSVGYMTPHTFKSNYTRKFGVSPTEDRRRQQGRPKEFGCSANPPGRTRYNSEIHSPACIGNG